jgi:hypothetical protein
MTDFVIKQLPYDLSNQASLALIGKYLKRININSLVDPTFSVRSGIANSDILKISACCVWARTTLMPSKASAKMPSSPGPGLARRAVVPHPAQTHGYACSLVV